LGEERLCSSEDVNARTRRYVEAGKRKNGIHIKKSDQTRTAL
jgi:hypothetical protein